MFIPVQHAIEVEMRALYAGAIRIECAFGVYTDEAAPSGAQVQAAADAFANWVSTDYRLHVSDVVTFSVIHAKSLHDRLAPTADAVLIGTVGALTGDPQVSFAAPLVQLGTGMIGRANRGSKYMFPATEAESSGNLYDTAFYSLILGDINTLRAALVTAHLPLAVVSKENQYARPVTSVYGDRRIARCGSRKLGHGG